MKEMILFYVRSFLMEDKMKNYEELASFIIKNVGGKENVVSLTHCVTRLRFILKDEKKANEQALQNNSGIMTVVRKGGQFQVVIGNDVENVYDAVIKKGDFKLDLQSSEVRDDKSIFDKLVALVAGIFTPILGLLCACGIIKGLSVFLGAVGWLEQSSGAYVVINSIGDTIFYFFPVFIGYTSAEKFGLNKFVGMAIGASLIHPNVAGLKALEPLYTVFTGTAFESNVTATFVGIPMLLMNYASSVLPAILATYFGSKVEKLMKKIIPTVLKMFLVPALTLLITVVVTLLAVGPAATWLSNLIGIIFTSIFEISPVISGALIGGFWQVLVMLGLHQGLVPIMINNLITNGYEGVFVCAQVVPFVTCAVVLAVYLKAKNSGLKEKALPAAISSFFGVSEPSIYGVTLPLKIPFYITLGASAVGGAIMGFLGVKTYTMGGLGIFIFPGFINPKGIDISFYGALAAVAIAMTVGFVTTLLLFKEKNTDQIKTIDDADDLIKQEIFTSPVKGEVIQLDQINDEVFASGSTGKGIGIIPSEGKIYAPCDGEVSMVFETGHAVGVISKCGAELLIHVGIDTVRLEGKGFEKHVAKGAQVKKGDLLISFDQELIKKEGYEDTVIFVVTNTESFLDVLTDISNENEVVAIAV